MPAYRSKKLAVIAPGAVRVQAFEVSRLITVRARGKPHRFGFSRVPGVLVRPRAPHLQLTLPALPTSPAALYEPKSDEVVLALYTRHGLGRRPRRSSASPSGSLSGLTAEFCCENVKESVEIVPRDFWDVGRKTSFPKVSTTAWMVAANHKLLSVSQQFDGSTFKPDNTLANRSTANTCECDACGPRSTAYRKLHSEQIKNPRPDACDFADICNVDVDRSTFSCLQAD